MNFRFFTGRVMEISDFSIRQDDQGSRCYKLFMVADREGSIVNFVIEPGTYFVDHVLVKVGDIVTGFYDANAPTPFIYPPQYRAVVMAKERSDQFVKVEFFDQNLVSSDGSLKLNLNRSTPILLENGQSFAGIPANRELIVIYSTTTRSIPAQTTPHKVIVLC
ncbi:hypothetical protein M3152_02885 [Sporosarcina luteola]|uniref:hypothetical protein n=1 Tax=Sporosarcina luteola TaxID=582850 RepID=UPI00203C42AD|nr:hypothetical protein [Sporosarcina luteola]MCM3636652.1 hypothetical protein [Sporosarcina luteola]